MGTTPSIVEVVTGYLKPDPKVGFIISDGDLQKLKATLDGLDAAHLALAVRDLSKLADVVAKKGALEAAQRLLQVVATMVPKLQRIGAAIDQRMADPNVQKEKRQKLMGTGNNRGSGGGLPPD